MTTIYKHIHTGECVIDDDAFDYAVSKLKSDLSEKQDFIDWYFEALFEAFTVPSDHIDDFIAYGTDYEKILREKED